MKSSAYLLRTPDRDISIDLQYGFRKHLTLTVYPDRRVVARIPYGFPERKAEAYFHKKIRWMIRHLDHFEHHPPETEKQYTEGEIHQYLGKEYELILEQGPGRVTLGEKELFLRVRDTNDPVEKKSVLDKWYRKETIRVLTPIYHTWIAKLQHLELPQTSLRFYKMKRRWGSCSSKGVITLNTELIKKAPELIDYVILHELCHLKIPAHNKAFYVLLESVLPDWKSRRRELNGR